MSSDNFSETYENNTPEKSLDSEHEKTYQCLTLEEFKQKRIEYIESCVVAWLDQRKLVESNIWYYAQSIDPKRILELDTYISSTDVSTLFETIKEFDLSKVNKTKFDQRVGKYRAKIPWYNHVYIALSGVDNVKWMLITPFSKWQFDDSRISVMGSYMKGNEYEYIVSCLLKKMMDFLGRPFVRFEKSARPLPPVDISPEQAKQRELGMEQEVTRRVLEDFKYFIVEGMQNTIKPHTQATKSTRVKNDGSWKERYYIGDEKVSKETHSQYIKFKKEHMTPGHQPYQYFPKEWVNATYENLSRSFFKEFVLDKDPDYTSL